ncbi:hypothetical protein PC116_g25082 [Phytophthora cactorum]|uniref:Uncharacterized protein n=1 Tax=Phytophthora cactorum TaxID=29920 RepID=A0A8T1AN43_9STRA|nr:hypothetical protein PC114_g23278 [Phytophthora cactorum]KAG2886342.1 hypothetical protein PC115_g20709 [Phytophthora cactorum]KAG2896712.1 hypothetical protein PC117_g22935 [Phytophthora cactorum]KAG4226512.1 hypothetical protein PC116_g25082 [Phytophthora cactorum]
MGQAQDGVRVAKEMTTTVTKTSSTTRTLPGARSVKRKKQRSSPLTWSSRRMPRAKQAAKESRVPSDSRTHKILQRRSPLRQASRYKRKNNLKFRIRSSETTKRFNSTNPPKLHYPSEFEWTHKIFRCTHGVTQAAVAPVARNTHAILIRNENHTHSHPNIGTQASAYLTTKTLPLDEHDREGKIPYFLAMPLG